MLLNWSATTLWLLSSFTGTFQRCRWWLTSVDDHVGHNNVVPERIPSRTTIPQDATKSGSGQRPGSDTDSYESGVLLKTTHNYALPCLSMNDAYRLRKAIRVSQRLAVGCVCMSARPVTLHINYFLTFTSCMLYIY